MQGSWSLRSKYNKPSLPAETLLFYLEQNLLRWSENPLRMLARVPVVNPGLADGMKSKSQTINIPEILEEVTETRSQDQDQVMDSFFFSFVRNLFLTLGDLRSVKLRPPCILRVFCRYSFPTYCPLSRSVVSPKIIACEVFIYDFWKNLTI